MELALLIQRVEGLHGLESVAVDAILGDDFGDPDLGSLDRLTRDALFAANLDTVSRLHFGDEFCQKLVPAPTELRIAMERARDLDVAFTLVTPSVTDSGLEEVRDLLDILSREWPGAEVVVNDHGVLRVVNARHPDLEPVLGRLLMKVMRDPRVTPYYDRPDAPPQALRALREPGLSGEGYRELLGEHGVRRVELDQLFQGLDLDLRALDLAGSVHVPFGFTASGRMCVPGSLGLSPGEKFVVGGECAHQCHDFVFRLGNEHSPFSDRDLVLYERGNTVFYPLTSSMVHDAVSRLPDQGVDRIVYAPEVPN